MDLPTLTLSVLVKKINRSNSSGDGFYTAHHCPSIGLTSVQPDSDYNRARARAHARWTRGGGFRSLQMKVSVPSWWGPRLN